MPPLPASPPSHKPVLLAEVLEVLAVRKGEVVADVTVGLGGHAVPLLRAAGRKGRLIGLDMDAENLEAARPALAATRMKFDLVHANFAGLPAALGQLGVAGVDALVADLGVASPHLDRPERGFSFLRPAPLDMRMDRSRGRTAAELLADIPEPALAQALRELGDEPDAEGIACAVVAARGQRPVDTTRRLVELVCLAKRIQVPNKGWGRLHPAARTFQAIRMLVNRELENLKALLTFLPGCLNPGGRAAIISFHSGEDRLVKTSFKEGRGKGLYAEYSEDFIRSGEEEEARNPRSWSAKLRWARRVETESP
ncbi:MAG: 16S rRNA (cytosine(1402)-N(4))-methyltransferase RsmH [Planctomycetes bacterium]|nr:16S rRNA (cytosine(1402)-N(4))-methyltransferase RsmH [Planctomycetota bacterium]